MLKVLLKVVLSCVGGAVMGVALAGNWQDYQNAKPLHVIEDTVRNDDTDVIETQLDRVDNVAGPYKQELKLSNTLESARRNMANYLEWIVFLGLSAAVVLIIYNGLRLVLSPLSDGEAQKVKKRLLYIVLGALLLTGFYFVITVLLNIVLDIAV